jgi:hypothetical protein
MAAGSSKMLVPVYQSTLDSITFQKTIILCRLQHSVALSFKPSPVSFQEGVRVLVCPTLYRTFVNIHLVVYYILSHSYTEATERCPRDQWTLCLLPSFLQRASPYTPVIICPFCGLRISCDCPKCNYDNACIMLHSY